MLIRAQEMARYDQKVSAMHCMLSLAKALRQAPSFGTTSVQLSERKNGVLILMRHQMKHLGFLNFVVQARVHDAVEEEDRIEFVRSLER